MHKTMEILKEKLLKTDKVNDVIIENDYLIIKSDVDCENLKELHKFEDDCKKIVGVYLTPSDTNIDEWYYYTNKIKK